MHSHACTTPHTASAPTCSPTLLPALISSRIRSPVAMCGTPKCLASREAYVPLPTPAHTRTHASTPTWANVCVFECLPVLGPRAVGGWEGAGARVRQHSPGAPSSTSRAALLLPCCPGPAGPAASREEGEVVDAHAAVEVECGHCCCWYAGPAERCSAKCSRWRVVRSIYGWALPPLSVRAREPVLRQAGVTSLYTFHCVEADAAPVAQGIGLNRIGGVSRGVCPEGMGVARESTLALPARQEQLRDVKDRVVKVRQVACGPAHSRWCGVGARCSSGCMHARTCQRARKRAPRTPQGARNTNPRMMPAARCRGAAAGQCPWPLRSSVRCCAARPLPCNAAAPPAP